MICFGSFRAGCGGVRGKYMLPPFSEMRASFHSRDSQCSLPRLPVITQCSSRDVFLSSGLDRYIFLVSRNMC